MLHWRDLDLWSETLFFFFVLYNPPDWLDICGSAVPAWLPAIGLLESVSELLRVWTPRCSAAWAVVIVRFIGDS